jgi:hypothetical protein
MKVNIIRAIIRAARWISGDYKWVAERGGEAAESGGGGLGRSLQSWESSSRDNPADDRGILVVQQLAQVQVQVQALRDDDGDEDDDDDDEHDDAGPGDN